MEFIKLQTFDNYIEANLVLNRFLNEGIEFYLKDEYTVTIDPLLSNAIGGIKLVVREDYIEKSIEVYNQMQLEKKQ